MTSSKKLAVVFAVVVGLALPALAQTPSIKGVWRVVEVTGADGKVNAKPEPGLYIFTDRHYSIMRVTEPRPVLPEKPTDKDMAASLRPIHGQLGHLSSQRYATHDPAVSGEESGCDDRQGSKRQS